MGLGGVGVAWTKYPPEREALGGSPGRSRVVPCVLSWPALRRKHPAEAVPCGPRDHVKTQGDSVLPRHQPGR